MSEPENEDSELFLMDADGTDLRQITDNTVHEVTPSWGPDGRIYYSSDSGTDAYPRGVYSLALGDGIRRRLSCDTDLVGFDPSAPDKRWNATSTGPRRPQTEAAATYTERGPAHRFVAIATSPDGPCEFPSATCIAGRRIIVKKRRPDGDVVVARIRSDYDGRVSVRVGHGRFFANVKPKEFTSPEGRRVTCLQDRTNRITIR